MKHYAGEVNYDSAAFCEKNKDLIYPDLFMVLQTSKLPFLADRFPDDVSDVRTASISSEIHNWARYTNSRRSNNAGQCQQASRYDKGQAN